MSACGNPECGVSTGIHDGLTFGSCELDHNGFWEFPCDVCARAHDAGLVKERERFAYRMRLSGHSQEDVDEYVRQADWLWCEGHPFTEKTCEELGRTSDAEKTTRY